VASSADRYADELVGQTIRVQRFGEGVRGKVAALLTELEEDLEKQLRKARLDGTREPSERLRRVDQLRARVKAMIAESTQAQSSLVHGELVELADATGHNFNRLSERVFSSNFLTAEFTPTTLARLVDGTLIHGNPASAWWAKQGADLQTRFTQQVRLGIVQGEPVDAIVKRIRGGEAESRVIDVDGKKRVLKVFSGGIMQTSQREAGALVRTAVQSVANRVMLDGYQQNADIVKALQAIITLDLRTSDICIAKDGGVWYLETGLPTPESKVRTRFPGPPPYHFNCRTVLGPVTWSWEELIDRNSKRTRVGKVLDSVPDGIRASVDGAVAGSKSYEQFLRGKSEKEQVEAIGRGKQQLWKSGAITLNQLADQSGRAITVAELKLAKAAPDAGALVLKKLDEAASLDALAEALRSHPALRDPSVRINIDATTDLGQMRDASKALVRNLDALGDELAGIAFGKPVGHLPAFNLSVMSFPAEGQAYARANWYKGGNIEFNSKYMATPALYAEAAKASESLRWFSVPTTPGATLSHEFGHVFDHASTGGNQYRSLSPFDAHLKHKDYAGSFAERWDKTVRSWLKKTWAASVEADAGLPGSGRIGVELSKYARVNTDELFAEAWAVIVERPRAQWPGIVQELAAEIRKAFDGSGLPMPKILQ